MIKQKQLMGGGPDQPREKWGDCFRACIASVLGQPVRSMPNFVALPDETWWDDTQGYLSQNFGLRLEFYEPDELEVWTDDCWGFGYGCYWLATVPSINLLDERHCVVMKDTEVVHDPARCNQRSSVELEDIKMAMVFVALEPWRCA